MEIVVAMFGKPVVVVAGDRDGCVVRLPEHYVWFSIDSPAQPCASPPAREKPTGPFTLEPFGATRRLAWPGGGCSVRALARVAFWGHRYATILDAADLTIIDGVTARQAHFELARFAGTGMLVHGPRLWIGAHNAVAILDTTSLETLVASDDRDLDISWRMVFPTEYRELPDSFAPQRARIVRGKTRDPAENKTPMVTDDPRLYALLAEVARDPDNDANRLVLVDLLQELGADYGTWIAEQGPDGKPRTRREALGPLAHFLDDLDYRGGLPWSATLVKRPPTDGELVLAAMRDVRLGMLSALRIGKGPSSIYARLVSSPCALGLRRVDVPEASIAMALIQGGRTQLTHLYDVRFAKDAIWKQLADPTFDRVVEIETIVQVQHLPRLLERVHRDEHGVFARARRVLVLRERFGHHDQLLHLANTHASRLPVKELRVAGTAFSR